MMLISTTFHSHRVQQLILTPAGRPITHAASFLEVVTYLLDLVIGKDSFIAVILLLIDKQPTKKCGYIDPCIAVLSP